MSEFWEVIGQFIRDLFASIFSFIKDVFLWIFEMLLNAVAFVFELIPLPDALVAFRPADHIPLDVAWFLNQAAFPECLAIIAAGLTFRIVRRILTLGIW